MNPQWKGAFLTRLAQDTAGTTLAIAAASILALMGVVGGAVDISRSYMAQSRLQQACDAGALAARKVMAGETLQASEIATGYRYFDFNFPAGSYGVTLTSRTYSQPVNSAGTPQAIVNGVVVATVPTTVMRIFGKETVDITVRCSSKMDIANADVAMVLDVTGSMTTDMRISSSGTATEDRISALRKAVKAFYDALGPGRAGGDLSKGRIRYAFIPYGTAVNVGHLLSHDQMVDEWTYQSREAVPVTKYGWEYANNSSESTANYGSWSPADAPPTVTAASRIMTNYDSWDTSTEGVGTGNGNFTFTHLDGTAGSLPRTVSASDSANCDAKNDLVAGKLKAVARSVGSETETYSDVAPVHPASSRTRNLTNTRTVTGVGLRYRYFKVSNTWGCRLESDTASAAVSWSQTQTKSTTRNITWTTYTGVELQYGMRTIDVSGLKNWSGGWNGTLSVTGLNRSGTPTTYEDIKLSGSNTRQDLVLGGTAQNVTVNWRGCVEERQMDPTITSSTSLTPVPANAFDLDSTLLANSGNDATRWRPWLWRPVYAPNATKPVNEDNDSSSDDDQCPPPALRLQEIGNYNTTILETPYPNLFQETAGSTASVYYPHTTSQWGTASTPAAERTKNSATLRNYIDRIKLYDGTLHDAGFMWGLHLVSGEGMFASDNPDRFNGQLVGRHIVFMTDGEMNPGEERYVFSGYNRYDGRLAPASSTDSQMIAIQNRRLRIQCEAAKAQGITVWVVAITSSSTDDYDDLRACASPGKFKSAATSQELISSFTNIAQSIGGLRISQ